MHVVQRGALSDKNLQGELKYQTALGNFVDLTLIFQALVAFRLLY